MTKSPDDFVVVAKVGAPYGIKGWTKIHSFTEWAVDIFEYSPLYIEDKQGWQTIKFTDGKEHGKSLVAKLVGYDSPEAVRVLTGKQIAIKRSQLPALQENEYYRRDLEGLTVINQDGKVLGIVSYVLETGSNDVLVVKNDKEHAIPYLLGSVILSVDLEKKEMRVDWEII